MTKQEQIEEVTKIINRRCEAELGQVHANSKDGKVTKTVDTSLIAKDIISAGYRKEKEVVKEIIGAIITAGTIDGKWAQENIIKALAEEYGVEIEQ